MERTGQRRCLGEPGGALRRAAAAGARPRALARLRRVVHQAGAAARRDRHRPAQPGGQPARLGGLIGTAISSLAGAHVPKIRWRITEGPWFENMIAVLEYNGTTARVRF